MSVRPGIQIIRRETPPPRSAPTDTSVWFVVGQAERGPLQPIFCASMADFERQLGDRISTSYLYDAVELFFREGGTGCYVSRVVGDAALAADHDLLDGSSGVSLTVTALGPGSYGDSLKVAVSAGTGAGTFKITISEDTTVVETSPDLVDQDAAVAWGNTSQYVRITKGASSLDPANVSATALAGGDDDADSIDDDSWATALARFSMDLGPGQVSAPDRSTDTGHTQLLAHAQSHNRVAILDPADTAVTSTLKTEVTGARAGNERYGGLWAPWVKMPGYIAGTIRTTPPSGLIAGLIARNELQYGPNAPAAGVHGVARYAYDVSQAGWSDSDRDDLNDNGVNVIRYMWGQLRVYGWRSLTNADTDWNWVNFGNSRLYMGIAAEANKIAEEFMFSQIDGSGQLISSFGGMLRGMLQRFWSEGALFGATPDEAFFVDVGKQVNTPERLANNELHAVLAVRMSPFGELVTIEIVKTPITEAVV